MNSALPFNPALNSLPVYHPGRPIEEVARELGLDPNGIIKLASNENPLGPSRLAVAAMRKAVTQVHLYPDGNAFYLKQALAAKLRVSPANLILGNGSNEVIELLGHALLGPGAEVVVSQYCFAVYPIVTALFGAKLVVVPARNYAHDLDAMLAAITPHTRIVFVANPNNPTGTVAPPEALARFVNAVPPNVLIALDEAYFEFLDNPLDFVPDIQSGQKTNLILLRTFSKIYGLAGTRIGYGIGDPDLIAALEKIRQPFNINSIAQAAALAALEDTKHVTKTRKINARGLKFYAKAFKQMKLEFIPSSANFILVKVGDGQRVFTELQKQGVIVRPMGGYQLPEWIRISIGTPRENERCVAALKAVLEGPAA
ncbi:MAG TPA: histidinol-phosphate transaminase [Verrucomicrobia bacterium]|nr:histidinol-phosphate transaminase [Verrucomicrobiota bacterium]HOB33138.1 histidinol-phosphate transaminase [Verrucomicrobiota bacterium]HOP96310.1 histidinol-phosphate transaminase [Verrucomicrobiota bacterium]HPU55001.1 histidinol-phosphate transaminase [Verrucomicrobiota bacterium]